MGSPLTPNELQRAIRYSGQLSQQRLWFNQAACLLETAQLIEPSVTALWQSYRKTSRGAEETPPPRDVQGSYFMLVGFAVENLLKGHLIKIRATEISNRLHKRLPKFLLSHDLVRLSRKAGFAFDIDEEDLLVRLSHSTVWSGRYPVPIDPDPLRGAQEFSNGRQYLTAYFGGNDVARLKALVDKVQAFVGAA